MTTRSTSVILYGEDPGAANFLLGIPACLTAAGIDTRLYTSGAATDYLRTRGETTLTLPDREPESILCDGRPDAVAVGTSENPDSPGLALIDAARRAGITTLGIVDHDAHAGLRFRGRANSPLAHAPEQLIVPDDTTARAYEALGFPSGRIAVSGHPQLDRAYRARTELARRERGDLRRETFPEAGGRKIVMFLAEQDFSLDPEAPDTADTTAWPGRTPGRSRVQAVFEAFLGACRALPERPFIVLRLHPKNRAETFDDYRDEYDHLSADGDPLQALYGADLAVGLTTVLLAEARALGTPVIAAPAHADEENWLPASIRGTPCVAADRAALAEMMKRFLRAPAETTAPVAETGGAARERICDVIAAAARASLEATGT